MRYSEIIAVLERVCADRLEAAAEARLLLEHYCGISPARIPLAALEDFSSPELKTALEARLSGQPLPYILGYRDFWKQRYIVTQDCLIPRPDTEILVQQAVSRLPSGTFLDLCTGSGCVGISVLCDRQDLSCLAVDASDEALRVAKANGDKFALGDRFRVCEADVLSADSFEGMPYWGLVCNPPYIESGTLTGLSREVLHEPLMALDGGDDGLKFYRAILSKCRAYLSHGAPVLFEIGWNQGDALKVLAGDGGWTCEIIQDYNGLDRVAVLTEN